jgi:Eukaryotic membrane protein family
MQMRQIVSLFLQFVELKGSVFKKFEKNNLFQMSCSDVRERFHLLFLLTIVSIRNLTDFSWNLGKTWKLFVIQLLRSGFNKHIKRFYFRVELSVEVPKVLLASLLAFGLKVAYFILKGFTIATLVQSSRDQSGICLVIQYEYCLLFFNVHQHYKAIYR